MKFETFKEFSNYEIRNLTRCEPSCFNGDVQVIKYKVTIQVVKESDDIIKARIQKMWDECENHHHWTPLKATAKKYGLELCHTTRK